MFECTLTESTDNELQENGNSGTSEAKKSEIHPVLDSNPNATSETN